MTGASTASPPPAADGELRRRLSSVDLATMIVAITIGAGIYSTPQLVARHLPEFGAVLACWIVGGAFAVLGVMVYAEVGTRIPETGGEYAVLRRVFGPWAGFLVSWLDFFLIAPNARVGLALVAASYLAPQGSPTERAVIAAALLVGLCAVTYVGVGPSMAAQRGLVALKVAGFVVLIAAVAWLPETSLAGGGAGGAEAAAVPGLRAWASAMLLVVFTYLGWQYIVSVAGEVRRPSRSLPTGLITGMALVVALYVATLWAYYRALGPAGVAASDGVAAAAAAVALGSSGVVFITTLVVVSTLGSMATAIMAHSRIAFAAARDGLLFRGLGSIHSTFAVPSRAVLAHLAVCLLLLALRQSLEVTFSALAFGRFIFMVLVGISLFRLRRSSAGGAGEPGVFRVPLYPVLPGLFLAGAFALLVARVVLQPRDTLIDLAILIGALPFLPLARRFSRRPSGDVLG